MREVVSDIGAERAAILSAIARASGDDWARTTPCDAWTVKDVLAHMVEGELWIGRLLRREVTEVDHVDPEAGIDNWRALPGEAVRAAFWQHGTATQRVLERLSEDAWHLPVRAFGCTRASQLARLHLFELALHGHDLTEALDLPAVWEPRLPFLVEHAIRSVPKALARNGLRAEGALAVVVDGRSWIIDGRSGTWQLGDGQPTVTVTAPAEDLVLHTTGRRSRAATSFVLEGDLAAAESIIAAWKIFG